MLLSPRGPDEPLHSARQQWQHRLQLDLGPHELSGRIGVAHGPAAGVAAPDEAAPSPHCSATQTSSLPDDFVAHLCFSAQT